MSFFSDWNNEVELANKKGEPTEFVKTYYRLEKEAYAKILKMYPNYPKKGTVEELANLLGFDTQYAVFVGFLEGVNESLENKLDLDTLTKDSEISLDIHFDKLLYNMYDAKANWLYDLEEWSQVMSLEERKKIAKEFRTDHIAVSTKVGRNEPCPCGSNKKYKNCCGKA